MPLMKHRLMAHATFCSIRRYRQGLSPDTACLRETINKNSLSAGWWEKTEAVMGDDVLKS